MKKDQGPRLWLSGQEGLSLATPVPWHGFLEVQRVTLEETIPTERSTRQKTSSCTSLCHLRILESLRARSLNLMASSLHLTEHPNPRASHDPLQTNLLVFPKSDCCHIVHPRCISVEVHGSIPEHLRLSRGRQKE